MGAPDYVSCRRQYGSYQIGSRWLSRLNIIVIHPSQRSRPRPHVRRGAVACRISPQPEEPMIDKRP